MELTDAIQDYVKEIYKLEASGSRVTTSALAARLGVSPPSATAMVKKLSSSASSSTSGIAALD